MPSRFPTAAQAWAALAAVAARPDGGEDVDTPSYRGPLQLRVFAAALLDLERRISALERQPQS